MSYAADHGAQMGSEQEWTHREGHQTLHPRGQARAPTVLPGARPLDINTVCVPSDP